MTRHDLDLAHDTWPAVRLGDALASLASKAKLARAPHSGHERRDKVPPPGDDTLYELALARYLVMAAERLGIACNQVSCTGGEVRAMLQHSAPLLLTEVHNGGVLAIWRTTGRYAWLINPHGRSRKVKLEAIESAVLSQHAVTVERGLHTDVAETIQNRDLAQSVVRVLLRERLRRVVLRDAWHLQDHPQARWPERLRRERVVQTFLGCVGFYLAHLGALAIAWYLITRASLMGSLESGWLWAWSLALVCALPLRLLASRMEWDLQLQLRVWLRRTVMEQVLMLRRDIITDRGSSNWHASLRELHGVDGIGLTLALRMVLASLDLLASLVIAFAAGFGWLFAAFVVLMLMIGAVMMWRIMRRYEQHADARFATTSHNIDMIRGHATRVLQQAPSEWHRQEDALISDLATAQVGLDRGRIWLSSLPRLWLALGLIPLTHLILTAQSGGPEVLMGAAAYFLANNAIAAILVESSMILDLVLTVRRAYHHFRHTRQRLYPDRTSTTLATVPGFLATKPGEVLLEARDLSFAYPGRPHLLTGVSLRICAGDRVVLTGRSGGGKTTLVALLTGLRQPKSGTLLVRGLDRQTLGDERWRRHIVAAPQFHENHIFSDTLLFNLALGCDYPPSSSVLADAVAICDELGLSPLIERMPSRYMEVVGAPGWTLSHGERSRIWLARALLQQPDVIVLDESFGALDPETLQLAMVCVRKRARAVIVVAHP